MTIIPRSLVPFVGRNLQLAPRLPQAAPSIPKMTASNFAMQTMPVTNEPSTFRPWHRFSLLSLFLVLGCARTTRNQSETVEHPASQCINGLREIEGAFEACEDEESESIETATSDGLPTQLHGVVLVPGKRFPAHARIEYQDSRPSPAAVMYLLPLDRRSIIVARLDVVIRDKNTDGIVYDAIRRYTHHTQGEVMRFSLPEFPKGDYSVEVKIAIRYLDADGVRQNEDNVVFREFTSTASPKP